MADEGSGGGEGEGECVEPIVDGGWDADLEAGDVVGIDMLRVARQLAARLFFRVFT